ncbi:hypothetical protein JS531_09380 [Bifidobacterium sp. CP2]|uniref:hypothetical protein n=1 Tax=Bifidobacterium sp. CP2 TaxID=2809025 RepID=UPI001BDCCC05|nr:hypothetical protein [Bifidobacterium sp. CP2]MBT1182152.1 hypothetical protein [Bifidobacterium sp. CP2]
MAEDDQKPKQEEQPTIVQEQQPETARPVPAQPTTQPQPQQVWPGPMYAQNPTGLPNPAPFQAPQGNSPVKVKKTVAISRVAFILLIVGIVLALIIGWFTGVVMSSDSIAAAQQQAAASEADRKKIAKAYDQLITQMEKESQQQQQEQQNEANKKSLKVTGGRWAGAADSGSGYRHAYVTIRNDGDKAIGDVIVTASKLDAGGRITGETNGFIQSAIQPGQSADVEILIEPGNDNIVAIQPTTIAINDPNGYVSYQVDAEKIPVTD